MLVKRQNRVWKCENTARTTAEFEILDAGSLVTRELKRTRTPAFDLHPRFIYTLHRTRQTREGQCAPGVPHPANSFDSRLNGREPELSRAWSPRRMHRSTRHHQPAITRRSQSSCSSSATGFPTARMTLTTERRFDRFRPPIIGALTPLIVESLRRHVTESTLEKAHQEKSSSISAWMSPLSAVGGVSVPKSSLKSSSGTVPSAPSSAA